MKSYLIKYLSISTIISALVFGMAYSAFAQNLQERFESRLPVIERLLAQGIIGENNQGYLEYLGAQRPEESIVNAENADREQVYAHIAKKAGSTPSHVGKLRAIDIAKKAKPGQMLQDAGGKWYKK